MTEKTFLTFDKRDEFNRKPIAEKIITLLESDIDVSPLLIDGDWGTGKSEFCQKLINLMDKEKYHLVYVDAFKTDYMEEPLLALLAEIIKTCILEGKTEEQNKEHKEKIKKIVSAAKFGIKSVLKFGVNLLLSQNIGNAPEKYKEAVEGVIKELSEKTIEVSTEALLKEQVEAEKNIKALQDCLKEIAKDKSIIIFIDELDRCRPDYAIDMLEIIKHVFEIDKIKIVLIANMKVIRLAVDHRYGHGVNSYSYLDKFIKFRITLPNSSKSIVEFSDDKNNSFTYLEHLVSNSSLLKGEYHNDLTKENNTNYLLNRELILSLVTRNNVSLRDVEKIIRNFEIYTAINKEEKRSPLMAVLYTFSVFLFAINPEMLFGLSKGNADIESVANVVGDLSSGYFCINSECQGVLIIISEMFCNSRKISYISEMGRYERYNYKKENFIENALANYPSYDIKKDMELRYSLSDYFNENSMELSHKIKYYVIIFIGILIIINSIIGTSEVLKQMKLNFTFIQKIMLFLFSGIPSGVIATSATAFFSVVFLFSVKTYEKKLYEHRIIGIIYTAIVSIIGLLGINFIMELSNLYKNYSFKVGHEFKLFIHFLKFVLRYKNLYIEIFNMYFCVNLFVIIFLGILLIFAKKNREGE